MGSEDWMDDAGVAAGVGRSLSSVAAEAVVFAARAVALSGWTAPSLTGVVSGPATSSSSAARTSKALLA